MLRSGTAAAADQGEAVLGDEGLLGVGQLRCRQRVVRPVLAQHRQARVRHARQRDTGVPGQVAQVLAHLGGAGGAVQADHVDAQRLQRRQRGTDLRPQQHGAGRLHGHRTDHRQVGAGRLERPAGTENGGLGLQEVLGGLHQQGVRAAGDHALGVLLVGVTQRDIRGVAQRRQLGAGPHGAEDVALLPGGGGELVGHLTGDPGAGLRQLEDPLGDVVLRERGEIRTEGIGLHAVDADREVLLVHRAHDVGPGEVEDLVAALELLEVLHGRILRLQHGAHRPVGDHHPRGKRLTQGCDARRVVGRWRVRGHGDAPVVATAVGFAPSFRGRTRPA